MYYCTKQRHHPVGLEEVWNIPSEVPLCHHRGNQIGTRLGMRTSCVEPMNGYQRSIEAPQQAPVARTHHENG